MVVRKDDVGGGADPAVGVDPVVIVAIGGVLSAPLAAPLSKITSNGQK